MNEKQIEKLLRDHEKQSEKLLKKVLRDQKKTDKELNKIKKPVKTETELVQQYAKIIMDKQTTRGMLSDKFKDMEKQTPTKNLWQDNDFFFSVVFQSRDQKYRFLDFLHEKFNITSNDNGTMSIQILNGLKLSEAMGLELKKEVANDYQPCNLELKDLILDI
jgi:hypothetical protein